MFVYSTTNQLNDKQYIGQTTKETDVEYLGSGLLIMKAIKKYGKGNFKRQILSRCSSQEELNEQEAFWIGALNSLQPDGYNLALGGDGPGRCSKETKRKMSEASKGRTRSEESKRKQSESMKGHKGYWTGIISFRKGKTYKEIYGVEKAAETKRKISESHKRKSQ